MQEAMMGRPIPVARDEHDRAEHGSALSNLADPIKSLELPAQQLAGTAWGDEIEAIRGRLALICFEVRADLDEATAQADEQARREKREAERRARREAEHVTPTDDGSLR